MFTEEEIDELSSNYVEEMIKKDEANGKEIYDYGPYDCRDAFGDGIRKAIELLKERGVL